jgi:putative protease
MARNSFQLDGNITIQRGDGLCFFNPQRELTGTTVNDVQGKAIFPDKIEGLAVGTVVYRNHDHTFLAQVEKSQSERKIAVQFRLAATLNGLALFARDEDGCEAMAAAEVEKVLAEKPEQAAAAIEKQLRKLGGTPFECSFVRNDLPEAYFIPLSVLNALRRATLDELEKQRQVDFPRLSGGALKNDAPFPQTSLRYQGNVLNEKARAFYQRHGVTQIEPAAESGLEMRGRKVMTTKHCIKHQLGYCARYQPGKANPAGRLQEPLALVDEQGNTFPLRFQCVKCEMEVFFLEAGGGE